MIDEQKRIEALKKEKSENSLNTESLANLLDSFTKTVFGEPHLSVYELLQNADDAAKNGQKIEIEVLLDNNFLIFRHNGAFFSDGDIVAICDIKSSKSKNIDKIGYKGIGFKSLFGFSDCVYIHSGNYTFRFEKEYWTNETIEIPWQIVPIWTENSERSAYSKYEKKGLTTFVIKVSDKYLAPTENGKNELNNILNKTLNDEKIILFLRHIQSINLNNVLKIVKESYSNETETIQKITISKRINEETEWSLKKDVRWLLKDFIIEIPTDLKASLNKLSNTECPERLKIATKSKLTFGVPIDENEDIVATDNNKVYCYFPTNTKMKHNFPFVINGDFLLDAKRTDFLNNTWNTYLFYHVGYKFIEWLSILVQTNKYKFQVNKVLKMFGTKLNKIHRAYDKGFQKAKEEFKFIPALSDENYLLKTTESIIDVTDFSQKLEQKWMGFKEKQVVNPKIEAKENLKKIGVEEFELNSLSKLLRNGAFKANNDLKQVKNNLKLIEFLYEKYKNTNDNLHDYPFILSNKNLIEAPKDIFIPIDVDLPDELNCDLDLIHSELYELLLDKKHIINWLRQKNIGLDTIKPFDIIKNFLQNETNEIDENNYLSIMTFILDNYLHFTNEELKTLRKINIYTKNKTFIPAEKCYLADCYAPELKLENFIDTDFISENYLNHGDKLKWRQLFIKIGIKDRPKIHQDGYTYPDILKLPQNYVNYLTISKEHINTTRIQNFATIEYYQYLENIDFSKAFWKYFIDNWDSLAPKLFQTKISLNGGRKYDKIAAHFKYHINTSATLPAENEESCYKANDLYSKKLKNILINEPIFFLDIDNEQANELGINYELGVEEILDLFARHETLKNLNAYELLCKYITELYQSDKTIKEIIRKKEVNLLSQTNDFVNAKDLYLFDIEDYTTSIHHHFIKLPPSFTADEQRDFCTLFDIQKVSKNDLDTTFDSPFANNDLKEILNNLIEFVSILICQNRNTDLETVKKSLQTKVDALSIFTVENLYTIFENKKEIIYKHKVDAYLTKNDLFVVSNWKNAKPIYALSKILAIYFDIETITREVNLFLTLLLNDEANLIQSWLIENGYETPKIVYETEKNDEISGVQEPNLAIFIEDAALEEEIKKIGIAGESFVFNNLKINLLRKFSYLKIIRNNHTELILGSEKGVHLQWIAEIARSHGKQSDYDINLKDNTGSYLEEMFIEVKTTGSKNEFYLTGSEFKLMNEKRGDYYIYRVTNIYQNPRYQIYESPMFHPDLSMVSVKYKTID